MPSPTKAPRKSARKPARKAAPKRKRKTAGRPRYSARTADKYDLYQKAVQSADTDVEFLARVFKSTRGRPALHFREDFCGTGLLSSHWIRQSPRHRSRPGSQATEGHRSAVDGKGIEDPPAGHGPRRDRIRVGTG